MLSFDVNISIVRARRRQGAYGATEADWDNPEIIPVKTLVAVQPVSSATLADGPSRHAVEATHVLLTKAPFVLEELREGDRVRVDGRPFDLEVKGMPAHWRTRRLAHTEADLEEIHG